MLKRHLAAAAIAASALTMVGCSDPAPYDPVADAEKAITDQISVELGLTSTVTCEAPPDIVVGTSFGCTATVSDGTKLTFTATIAAGNTVTTAMKF